MLNSNSKKITKITSARPRKNYLDIIKAGIKSPLLLVTENDNSKNLKKARRVKLNMSRNSFSEALSIKEQMYHQYIKLMMPLANSIKEALKPFGWTLGMIKGKFIGRKGEHYISNILGLRKNISKRNPAYSLAGWQILNGWNKWISGFNSYRFKKSDFNPNRRKKISFKAVLPS